MGSWLRSSLRCRSMLANRPVLNSKVFSRSLSTTTPSCLTIDLRSDTVIIVWCWMIYLRSIPDAANKHWQVTKPCEGMRAAMASARVGDDVYGEDATTKQLEVLVLMMGIYDNFHDHHHHHHIQHHYENISGASRATSW